MNPSLVKLEKKILTQHYKRILKSDHAQKMAHLRFTWHFLHRSPAFSSIVDTIKAHEEEYWRKGYALYHNAVPVEEDQMARFFSCYYMLVLMLKDSHPNPMNMMGAKYSVMGGTIEQNFQVFISYFLEHFIQSFLNMADKQLLLLGLLKKYKQRSEWFNKSQLAILKTERELKKDLYKFLFDQGLPIFVEPVSPSGEADIIAIEKDYNQFSIIEGKIFDVKKAKSYIYQGVRQLKDYMRDHQAQVGYLSIYCNGPKELVIENNPESSLPFIRKNELTIFFVVIDITDQEKTASTRPAREQVTISLNELQECL